MLALYSVLLQVIDTHNYDFQPTIQPATTTRAAVLLEMGGIGMVPSTAHVYDESVKPFWFHEANTTGQMTNMSVALLRDPVRCMPFKLLWHRQAYFGDNACNTALLIATAMWKCTGCLLVLHCNL